VHRWRNAPGVARGGREAQQIEEGNRTYASYVGGQIAFQRPPPRIRTAFSLLSFRSTKFFHKGFREFHETPPL